jgi:hypothetical protein
VKNHRIWGFSSFRTHRAAPSTGYARGLLSSGLGRLPAYALRNRVRPNNTVRAPNTTAMLRTVMSGQLRANTPKTALAAPLRTAVARWSAVSHVGSPPLPVCSAFLQFRSGVGGGT